MPVDKILSAELAVEPDNETYLDVQQNPVTNICHAADKQLFLLVDWAKRVPHFVELPLDDQVTLLKTGKSDWSHDSRKANVYNPLCIFQVGMSC